MPQNAPVWITVVPAGISACAALVNALHRSATQEVYQLLRSVRNAFLAIALAALVVGLVIERNREPAVASQSATTDAQPQFAEPANSQAETSESVIATITTELIDERTVLDMVDEYLERLTLSEFSEAWAMLGLPARSRFNGNFDAFVEHWSGYGFTGLLPDEQNATLTDPTPGPSGLIGQVLIFADGCESGDRFEVRVRVTASVVDGHRQLVAWELLSSDVMEPAPQSSLDWCR